MGLLERKVCFLSGPIDGEEDPAKSFAAAKDACTRAGAVEVFDPMDAELRAMRDGFGYGSSMHMLDDVHELTKRSMRDGRMAQYYSALVMIPGYGQDIRCYVQLRVAEECGIEVVQLYDVLDEIGEVWMP